MPWLYFDYLRNGDATPLKGVFYHNAMDVVAMAALLSHVAAMLDDPFAGHVQHGLDFVALGKLYEDLGQWDMAARLFEHALEMKPAADSEQSLSESDFAAAIQRLSILQKRRGDLDEAVRLWEEAAAQGHIYAHVELAKHYEHREKNYPMALEMTLQALEFEDSPAIRRREQRLKGRLNRGHLTTRNLYS